jgi:hypothetical protein
LTPLVVSRLIVRAVCRLALSAVPALCRVRPKFSFAEATIVVHVPIRGKVPIYYAQYPFRGTKLPVSVLGSRILCPVHFGLCVRFGPIEEWVRIYTEVEVVKNGTQLLDDVPARRLDESFDDSRGKVHFSEAGELSATTLDNAVTIHVCILIENMLHHC